MKGSQIKLAPSLLAADPLNFEKEIREGELLGADFHHVDVMDGHFVPNLTFGIHVIKAMKKVAKIPLDVHIMVSNPDEVALQYVDAGADILTFPIESCVHSHYLIQAIQAKGAKAGVAINPGTSLDVLKSILNYVDIINVMSVNPGFGGQPFIKEIPEKIGELYAMLKELGREKEVLIEVDGGIDDKTAPLVVAKGANVLVAGSYIYGAKDRNIQVSKLNDSIQAI